MPLAGCGSGVCTTVSGCSDIKDVETADTGLTGARAAVKFGLWPTPLPPRGDRGSGTGATGEAGRGSAAVTGAAWAPPPRRPAPAPV